MLGANPTRYTYGFELSDERVEAEWLHAYPEGKRVVWFDREADRPEAEGGEFLFPDSGSGTGTGFRGQREVLVPVTRANALFLSTGATLNDPQLGALHRWFNDNLWLITPGQDVKANVRRPNHPARMLTRRIFYPTRIQPSGRCPAADIPLKCRGAAPASHPVMPLE